MEDDRQFDLKTKNRNLGYRPNNCGPSFVNLDDFIAQIGLQDQRIKASEAKSLKELTSRLGRAKKIQTPTLVNWAKARALLVDAIRHIDTALRPLGLSLSMADDAIHDDLAGAVEIRLNRSDGGRPRAMLDIEIGLDGCHRTRVFDTQLPLQAPLPPIGVVTQEDYQVALMAFVHGVMRTAKPRKAQPCPHCAQPALFQAGSACHLDESGDRYAP